jgi:hypothetical protein
MPIQNPGRPSLISARKPTPLSEVAHRIG